MCKFGSSQSEENRTHQLVSRSLQQTCPLIELKCYVTIKTNLLIALSIISMLSQDFEDTQSGNNYATFDIQAQRKLHKKYSTKL